MKNKIKKDFIELLSGCTKSFDGDNIEYEKDGEWFFYHQKTNNIFYFRCKIWFDFEKKYYLNHKELSELLSDIIEEVLNCKGVTPILLQLKL